MYNNNNNNDNDNKNANNSTIVDWPLVISCQLQAKFVRLSVQSSLPEEGIMIPHEYVQTVLDFQNRQEEEENSTNHNNNNNNNNSIMEQYITDVLWNIPPPPPPPPVSTVVFSKEESNDKSIFYEVQRAKIVTHIERYEYDNDSHNVEEKGEHYRTTSSPPSTTLPVLSQSPVSSTITTTQTPNIIATATTPNVQNCTAIVLQEANADGVDTVLTVTEYMSFINLMTNNAYEGFPFQAIPVELQNVYTNMMSTATTTPTTVTKPPPKSTTVVNLVIDNLLLSSSSSESDPSPPVPHRTTRQEGDEEQQFMKHDRATMLCRAFTTTIINNVANGRLQAAMIQMSTKLYLEHQEIALPLSHSSFEDDDEEDDDDEKNIGTLMRLAFQNLVDHVIEKPFVKESLLDATTTEEEEEGLSRR